MKYRNKLIPLFALLLLASCGAPTFRTFYKPVIFDAQRKQLSLDYMADRYGIHKETAFIDPKIIVLHWTAIPTLEQSFEAMNPVLLSTFRKQIGGVSNLNVSAQFLVDRDGTIFQLLPETAFARHVIGLNYTAIGIENVGGSKNGLTRAQLKANEQLVRYLTGRYKIEYLIGHYEYQNFIGHSLWREQDPNYLTQKTDPGKSFMKKIRHKLKDLDLKAAPNK